MTHFSDLRRDPASRRQFLTTMTAAGLGAAAVALLAGPAPALAKSGKTRARRGGGASRGTEGDAAAAFPGIPGASNNEIVLNFALVLEILEAQARGDAAAVLERMPRCERDPVCSRVTTERVARLKRPGDVEILNYEPSAQAAFTDQTGTGRVAWRTDEQEFPVVQCVVVRREGPLTGGEVEVVSISNPIGLEAGCGR